MGHKGCSGGRGENDGRTGGDKGDDGSVGGQQLREDGCRIDNSNGVGDGYIGGSIMVEVVTKM